MAVVISEIVTEVVLTQGAGPDRESATGGAGGSLPEDALDAVVRRATERVLEVLRREWDG